MEGDPGPETEGKDATATTSGEVRFRIEVRPKTGVLIVAEKKAEVGCFGRRKRETLNAKPPGALAPSSQA